MPKNAELEALLNYDPIARAEKLTGQRGSDTSIRLGMAMGIQLNQTKRAALEALGDTVFGGTMEDAIRIAEAQGFALLLTIPFMGKGWKDEPDTPEEFQVYWNAELSVLLTLESYRTTSLNTGKMYFSWERNPNETYRPQASGHWHDGKVFVGNFDIREAFVYNLNRMKETGTFLTEWPETGWLWLLHWMDVKADGYDYDAIKAERMAQLPEHVRKAMAY